MKIHIRFFCLLIFVVAIVFASCGNTSSGDSIYSNSNSDFSNNYSAEIDIAKITTYTESTAHDAVEASKVGWNLGNTFDCYENTVNPYGEKSNSYYETRWGNPVATQGLIHYVKSLGFDAIRIPVTWGEKLESDNTIRPVWMSRVKQVVEWALNEDLYVILNVHHDTGRKGWLRATEESYEKYKSRFEKIWQQIAAEFKGYSEKLMFEGFNELIDGKLGNGTTESGDWGGSEEGFEYDNKWNALFVKTVRASGGNNATRNLICNTYAASASDAAMDAFVLPTDTAKGHLICEIHNYNTNKDSLAADFTRTALFSEHIGCPVIIGEWGTSTDKTGGESFSYLEEDKRIEHARTYISEATKRGLACYLWDDGGSYKQVDRKKLSLVNGSSINTIVGSVQKTVSLSETNNNIAIIKNSESLLFEIDENLRFTWTIKPVIYGNTSGKIAYRVFSTDGKTTYLWYEEESYSDMNGSVNLLQKIIDTSDNGVSSKADLPENVFVLVKYVYYDSSATREEVDVVTAFEFEITL